MAELSEHDKRALFGPRFLQEPIAGDWEDLDFRAFVRGRLAALKEWRFHARTAVALGILVLAADWASGGWPSFGASEAVGGLLLAAGLLCDWAISRLKLRLSKEHDTATAEWADFEPLLPKNTSR